MSNALDILIAAVVILLNHKLFVIAAAFLAGICGVALIRILHLRRLLPLFLVAFTVCLIASLFFGTPIRNQLIKHAGIEGEGMITRVSDTSSTYNDQPIQRFETMLRLADGSTVKTRFYSDDFNVVDGHDWNLTIYPGAGERFKVRYLPRSPEAFVVLTETESEYGRRLIASERGEEITALENQLKMAPDDKAARSRLEELKRADPSLRPSD